MWPIIICIADTYNIQVLNSSPQNQSISSLLCFGPIAFPPSLGESFEPGDGDDGGGEFTIYFILSIELKC